MADSDAPDDFADTAAEQGQVSIDYRKTDQYHTIQADGFHGGVTPAGKFQFYPYTESNMLPDMATREILDNGDLGPEVHDRESDARVVREVEASVSMTPDTALRFLKLLSRQLQLAAEHGLIDKNLLEDADVQVTVQDGN